MCDLLKPWPENSERERDDRGKRTRAKQASAKGFRLSHDPVDTEETQREKVHRDVKVKCYRFQFVSYYFYISHICRGQLLYLQLR